MSDDIVFHSTEIKVVIDNQIFKVPCNMGITVDNDKLLIVLKQDKMGSVQEMLKIFLREGERPVLR